MRVETLGLFSEMVVICVKEHGYCANGKTVPGSEKIASLQRKAQLVRVVWFLLLLFTGVQFYGEVLKKFPF